jgi:hypothetical protein
MFSSPTTFNIQFNVQFNAFLKGRLTHQELNGKRRPYRPLIFHHICTQAWRPGDWRLAIGE